MIPENTGILIDLTDIVNLKTIKEFMLRNDIPILTPTVIDETIQEYQNKHRKLNNTHNDSTRKT